VVRFSANMTANDPNPHYPLGSTDAEHARLIRQAKWLVAHTERLFRTAGIGRGQWVLDLGSGVGDVSLIAASLVGPSGKVVGIERDPRSIARASARMAEAGFHHVSFTQSEVSQIPLNQPFDAAIGRYILMFLPDPVEALRSLSRLVRPGGVFAFQEPCWESFLLRCESLPLWRKSAALLRQAFEHSGANTRMGPALSRVFREADLPAPATWKDTLVGSEQWLPDCLHSLRPRMTELNLPTESLGDFDTLAERLHAEVKTLNKETPLSDLVSAWTRKPAN
jgi:SAM-dependent methyltransferase